MKLQHLILAAVLAVSSCAGSGMVPTEGAVGRTIERVVERHDSYVEADEDLSDAARAEALGQSSGAMAMLVLPEVEGVVLSGLLEPVMERHDSYVLTDQDLDELERSIYLESTERLRSLFSTVPVLAQ